MYGQTVWHEGTEKWAKKPTCFCTNSIEVKKAIEATCDGSHEHVQLMSGLAKQCGAHPPGLVELFMVGLSKQIAYDKRFAAMTTCRNCASAITTNQPEFLAVSRKWIFDTGCGRDLIWRENAQQWPEHWKEASPLSLYIADGATSTSDVIEVRIDVLQEVCQVYILHRTPAVTSCGKRTMGKGHAFIWMPNKSQCIVLPNGEIIVLRVYGGIPFIDADHQSKMATCTRDQILNMTGLRHKGGQVCATVSTKTKKHQVQMESVACGPGESTLLDTTPAEFTMPADTPEPPPLDSDDERVEWEDDVVLGSDKRDTTWISRLCFLLSEIGLRFRRIFCSSHSGLRF